MSGFFGGGGGATIPASVDQTELGHLDGVVSAIQDQINARVEKASGAGLTDGVIPVWDSGQVGDSDLKFTNSGYDLSIVDSGSSGTPFRRLVFSGNGASAYLGYPNSVEFFIYQGLSSAPMRFLTAGGEFSFADGTNTLARFNPSYNNLRRTGFGDSNFTPAATIEARSSSGAQSRWSYSDLVGVEHTVDSGGGWTATGLSELYLQDLYLKFTVGAIDFQANVSYLKRLGVNLQRYWSNAIQSYGKHAFCSTNLEPVRQIHAKDTANPQMRIDDGTNTVDFRAASGDLEISLDGGSTWFTVDKTAI